jgi:hypothetical protein
MGVKRLHLPESIEILVPTRDRAGKALSATKQREWKDRLARYLLEALNVTGFQESKREGAWKQEQKDLREYDPATGRLYLVREKCTPCGRAARAPRWRPSGRKERCSWPRWAGPSTRRRWLTRPAMA